MFSLMPILLEDLDLRKAERLLCQQALSRGGSIVKAADLLGITRHALKRRMIKHQLEWPLVQPTATTATAPSPQASPLTRIEPVVSPDNR